MSTVDIVGWILTGLVIVACLLAAWRFVALRHTGTKAVMRRLPARENRGWRHGVLRYRGERLDFFKLRSVSPKPDLTFERSGFLLKDRRDLTSLEQRFMVPERKVLVVKTSLGEFEWVLDSHAEMALLAWVESAPTQPMQRMDVKTAQKYFKDR